MARRERAATEQLDRQLTAAGWWREFLKNSNETFLPLLWDQHRFLVMMGGGGSGKSIFAGRKILERAVTEPGHRFLVCRKVGKSLRESCYKQLVEQARAFYPDAVAKIPQGRSSDMYLTFKNGSEILFAGLDDVEKLKSIYNITGIWAEEATELLEGDLNQLNIRLRGKTAYYKQIILTFNPIYATHWLKKRFFDRQDPEARVHHSTYRDNRFLPEEDRRQLEAYREIDPYYYQVYALGEWGVLGRTLFPAQLVQRRLETLKKPLLTGRFIYDYDGVGIGKIEFQPAEDGDVEIYSLPEKGVPYVLGGDTAGEGSDKFVGWLIDNTTGRQAARLRHTYDEDVYARQMYCLGKWYNGALIGIETNYSTYPQKELERLGYRHFYTREQEDEYTGKLKQSFGFKTTALTRPIILANLVQIFREHPDRIMDRTTLEEMLTFVVNEKGRAEAAAGAHDDCIMAAAICYYIRSQQSMVKKSGKKKKSRWDEDTLRDYRQASQADKAKMRALWGDPFEEESE